MSLRLRRSRRCITELVNCRVLPYYFRQDICWKCKNTPSPTNLIFSIGVIPRGGGTCSGICYGCMTSDASALCGESQKWTHNRCKICIEPTHNGQKWGHLEGKWPFFNPSGGKNSQKGTHNRCWDAPKSTNHRCKLFQKSTNKGRTSIDTRSMGVPPSGGHAPL